MTRTTFVHDNEKFWTDFYLGQAKQTGHGDLAGFQGTPYQRGHGLGSFFGRLFRAILPVAKKVGKSVLKTAGKEALTLGADVMGDVAQGHNVKESLRKRGGTAAKNLMNKANEAIQSGGKTGSRPVVSKVIAVKKRKYNDYLSSDGEDN